MVIVVCTRLPVDEPVAFVLETTNLPSDWSNPMNAFESSPISMTIPASPVGVPVRPLPTQRVGQSNSCVSSCNSRCSS